MPVTSMLDREVCLYTEVDRLIGLAAGTARRWINGYRRSGKIYDPILRVTPLNTDWATWGEFVETRILAEYRDENIPTARLRGAIDGLRRMYGIDYPLAHLRPYLAVHNRDLTIKGDEVGLCEDELVIRTGQQLLGGPSWNLIFQASLAEDELGEKIVTELRPDPKAWLVLKGNAVSSGADVVTAVTSAPVITDGATVELSGSERQSSCRGRRKLMR